MSEEQINQQEIFHDSPICCFARSSLSPAPRLTFFFRHYFSAFFLCDVAAEPNSQLSSVATATRQKRRCLSTRKFDELESN